MCHPLKNTLLILCCSCCAFALSAQSKHALLIGIARYQDTAIGPTYADNDLAAVGKGLEALDYPNGNIRTLLNEQATLGGILRAWDDLTRHAQPGDTIWIHLSVHGQRMIDLAPIDESDRLDECILAYDSPADYPPNDPAFGQRHLRDDTINALCKALCDKIGPQGMLFLSMDACHAGSGARNQNSTPYRGIEKILGLDNDESPAPESRYSLGTLPSNMAVFYAAAPNEVSYATTGNPKMGALSNALSKAMLQLDQGSNVQELFSRIQGIMRAESPNQTPSYEGNGDLLVQSGDGFANRTYACSNAYFKHCWIDAGLLHGIYPNTQVAFFLPGQDSPIATGKVTNSNAMKALVQINEEMDYSQLDSCRARITARSYGSMRLRWKWQDVDEALAAALETRLEDKDAITIVRGEETYDLALRCTTDSCYLYTYDSLAIWHAQRSHPGLEDNLVLKAKQYMLSQYIGKLEFRAEGIHCSVDLILPDLGGISVRNRRDAGGIPYVAEGERHYFVITNNSPSTIYFALVDINPDGTFGVLPGPHTKPGNIGAVELAPGASHTTETYHISPPYGLQTLKLLAAKTRQNWYDSLNAHYTRSTRSGFKGGLRLFTELNDLTGGKPEEVLEDGEVGSQTLRYRIVPKN